MCWGFGLQMEKIIEVRKMNDIYKHKRHSVKLFIDSGREGALGSYNPVIMEYILKNPNDWEYIGIDE